MCGETRLVARECGVWGVGKLSENVGMVICDNIVVLPWLLFLGFHHYRFSITCFCSFLKERRVCMVVSMAIVMFQSCVSVNSVYFL